MASATGGFRFTQTKKKIHTMILAFYQAYSKIKLSTSSFFEKNTEQINRKGCLTGIN